MALLYHSQLCFQSLKIRDLLQRLSIQHSAKEVEYSRPVRGDGIVYGNTPILVHDGRVVEDSRAIIRYINENLSASPILPINPRESADLFSFAEKIDDEVLPVLAAPLFLSGRTSRSQYARSVKLTGKGGWYQVWRLFWTWRRIVDLKRRSVGENHGSKVELCLQNTELRALDERFFHPIVLSGIEPLLQALSEKHGWGERIGRYQRLGGIIKVAAGKA